MIKGLAPKTEKVFIALSELDFIKDYILVGGTALSLQIQNRLSEDLDFMRWRVTKSEHLEIPWNKIEAHLKKMNLGKVTTDVLDFNQVLFVVADVKLSFYFRDSYAPEDIKAIPFMGSIRVADLHSIGVMKIDAMLRRGVFRDYYDLYSILKQGIDIDQLIGKAAKYSGYATKTKNITAIISNGSRFIFDDSFKQLKPIYNISKDEIESFIKKNLEKNKEVVFTEQEIPTGELAKLGLSFNDLSKEDQIKLLKGEKTGSINLKGYRRHKSVQISLERSTNKVDILVYPIS